MTCKRDTTATDGNSLHSLINDITRFSSHQHDTRIMQMNNLHAQRKSNEGGSDQGGFYSKHIIMMFIRLSVSRCWRINVLAGIFIEYARKRWYFTAAVKSWWKLVSPKNKHDSQCNTFNTGNSIATGEFPFIFPSDVINFIIHVMFEQVFNFNWFSRCEAWRSAQLLNCKMAINQWNDRPQTHWSRLICFLTTDPVVSLVIYWI